ncbi:MAG: hypothetical protein CME20_12705 [Gemmatimonadetes bacterium]|nr:hypothetical protein [Gemmatimonadota bacterium]
MKRHSFALVDCNNFYANCEQVFQPQLQKRPVVVLGNNDGIVVARSQEAKALDVGMGQPYFKIRRAYERQGGLAFSSNYALYGDMSGRVMETLRQFTDQVEVYSIDEAFLSLSDRPRALAPLAVEIRRLVKKWTGLPVSIGIGPTKTLAKLANKIAKANDGQYNLVDHPDRDRVLARVPVADIWGIGDQYRKLLQTYSIKNAAQLARIDDKWARRQMTVMGQRTVLELRGIPCFALGEEPAPKKAIHRARQFGRRIVDFDELCEPLAEYAASAARELRRQRSVCAAMSVHIATGMHDDQPYHNSIARCLPWPTALTGELIGWACEALAQIYRPAYAYRRCGVLLSEIALDDTLQTSLFTNEYYDADKRALMDAIDRIEAAHGRHALRHAREGLNRGWRMRQTRRSPRYTTRWDELPVAQ